jgi:UDP-N-acetylglucosamine pyrophosphorylase
MSIDHFPEFEAKMRAANISSAAIRAFQNSYSSLLAGETGMMPENSIQAVTSLPRFEDIPQDAGGARELLSQSLIIKLNGGLGTSMGLERAKSLLQVKNGLTFLDFIARQVLHLRKQHGVQLRFMLMNSFNTSGDTLDFLAKYPELGAARDLELLQSQVPKVDAASLRPASWPENPALEWCPPGHGDIYPSLLGSGALDRLLDEGVRYAFVSNSDNLGASLDLGLLAWFAASGLGFLMEVAERTMSDRKGGHLARRGSTFLLRESAQCPEQDMAQFQDIKRHRFFNTNNLWIRLDELKKLLNASGGFIPLPMIKNAKTVDPRKKDSPRVFQLETAMGAAIQCLEKAGAMIVPRSRFAPVKTTSDLLGLRSDAYAITEDWRVILANGDLPPTLDLDANQYKLVDQLDQQTASGVPSLKQCRELVVRGPVQFSSRNVFQGKVTVRNPSAVPKPLPEGEYRDRSVELP